MKNIVQCKVVSKEANLIAACISLRDRFGYSSNISFGVYPPSMSSSIIYTGIRVLLITGIPSIICEFISIQLEKLSNLWTTLRSSDFIKRLVFVFNILNHLKYTIALVDNEVKEKFILK